MFKEEWMKYVPCHRSPERSFVSGVQSLFCCRCTGMHLGFFLGFLYLVFTSNFMVSSVSAGNLVLLIPMLVDSISQRLGWRQSKNAVRFATGLLFGFGMAPFFGISESGPAQSFEPYLLFAVSASIVAILAQRYALNEEMVRLFSTVSLVTYPTGLILALLLLVRFVVFILG